MFTVAIWALALTVASCSHGAGIETAGNKEQRKQPQGTNNRVLVYPSQPESEKRLEWFKDAKFGMMICWGIYSPRGGMRPDGTRQRKVYTEWYQVSNNLSHDEYAKLAGEFNPKKFDAEKWVLIAKNAGMKYITLITKFHDGFAMYDSAYSKFDIVDATPFKRDVAMELREACDKHGMKLIYYYSHCLDWEDYNAWNATAVHEAPNLFSGRNDRIDHEKYLVNKALPQVAELCTRYRPDGIWFDTPRFNSDPNDPKKNGLDRAVSKRFHDLVRKLSPNCLINSRIVHGARHNRQLHADLFDYLSLGDHKVPKQQSEIYTETPGGITRSYGYDASPNTRYAPAAKLLGKLITTVANNGNLTLDVGPDGDGVMAPQAQAELVKMGQWMKMNGEAIYGTKPYPTDCVHEWGKATTKGNNTYLFPLKANDTVIRLTVFGKNVENAYVLGSGTPVVISQDKETVSVTVPRNDSELPQVIVLKCED